MTNFFSPCDSGGTSNFSNGLGVAMILLALLTRNLGSVLSNVRHARTQIVTFPPAGNQQLSNKGMFVFRDSLHLLTFPRWIYALILTIDANFRLKNKDRKVTSDPPLGDGWGHWVPSAPYHDYIAKYGYQEEVRSWLVILLSRHLSSYTHSPTCVIQPCAQSTMQIRRSHLDTSLLEWAPLYVPDMGWFGRTASEICRKVNGESIDALLILPFDHHLVMRIWISSFCTP